MNKKAVGNIVYKICYVIAIVLLLIVMFLFKEEDKVKLSIIRYMNMFFCFGVILPIGIIVREYCQENFNLKKLILKAVICVLTLILGLVGYFTFVKSDTIALFMLIFSICILLYTIIPTKLENKKSRGY